MVTPLNNRKVLGLKGSDCKKFLQNLISNDINLIDDGLVGQQIYAGEATRLAYGTDEAEEGKNAFLEKRKPNFKKYPKFP